MQLHTIKKVHAARKKRIGRGGKRGSFSGRGIKGQKARSGRHIRPDVRDLIKKIPALRGYTQASVPRGYKVAVPASRIARAFKPGQQVSPQTLIAKKLIRRRGGRVPQVKILAAGDYLKGLLVKNCEISRKI